METENSRSPANELTETVAAEETSSANQRVCDDLDSDDDRSATAEEKSELLMALLVRLPVMFLAGWLIWQISLVLFLPSESGISQKAGDSCGFICFVADAVFGPAVAAAKVLAALAEATLASLFLWCLTGSGKLLYVAGFIGLLAATCIGLIVLTLVGAGTLL